MRDRRPPTNAASASITDHPPVYTHPPILPSLDYSPDGKLLAVAGSMKYADRRGEPGARGRLIGMADADSSRLRFSPDGGRLAVAGGLPGAWAKSRFGCRQERSSNCPRRSRSYSVRPSAGRGTANGSPLAVPNNSVRVIDADSGEQVMFQGGHSDWVLDTFFVADNSHVRFRSRDMSVKLTEIATQRLIDNVTSITPVHSKGACRPSTGHPKFNIFVAGGSDGLPRVYRVFRETVGKSRRRESHRELFPQMGRTSASASVRRQENRLGQQPQRPRRNRRRQLRFTMPTCGQHQANHGAKSPAPACRRNEQRSTNIARRASAN